MNNATGVTNMNLTEHVYRLVDESRQAAARLEAAERERVAMRAEKAERYNTPGMPALLKVQAE